MQHAISISSSCKLSHESEKKIKPDVRVIAPGPFDVFTLILDNSTT